MELVSAHLIGRTAAVLVFLDVIDGEFVLRIYFDTDRLTRAVFEHLQGNNLAMILEDAHDHKLPEQSDCEPVQFCGWAARFFSAALTFNDHEEKERIMGPYRDDWHTLSFSSQKSEFPDADSSRRKAILFLSTPQNEHHVFLVYSQRQASTLIRKIGGRLVPEMTETLLTLPADCDDRQCQPVALSGEFAYACFFGAIVFSSGLGDETEKEVGTHVFMKRPDQEG